MKIPPDHAEFLAKGRTKLFRIPDGAKLTPDEVGILSRYGFWMEALATGTIEPITWKQRHFVLVANGKEYPKTRFEFVFKKYWEFTHILAPAPRSLPLPDELYGGVGDVFDPSRDK